MAYTLHVNGLFCGKVRPQPCSCRTTKATVFSLSSALYYSDKCQLTNLNTSHRILAPDYDLDNQPPLRVLPSLTTPLSPSASRELGCLIVDLARTIVVFSISPINAHLLSLPFTSVYVSKLTAVQQFLLIRPKSPQCEPVGHGSTRPLKKFYSVFVKTQSRPPLPTGVRSLGEPRTALFKRVGFMY